MNSTRVAVNGFVSYARHDKVLKDALLRLLEPHFGASATFTGTRWADDLILPGSVWRAEIQSAMEASSFGILLISPAFLASRFIREVELSYFLAGGKPFLPVALRRVDSNLHDLGALAGRQILQLATGRGEQRAFEECSTGAMRSRFAMELFQVVEQVLSGFSDKRRARDRKDPVGFRQP